MTRLLTVMRHRLEAVKARTGTREWQVKRRESTRQLIESGGLVVKADLVPLADDDRALLYGAFLWMAAKLQSDQAAHTAAQCKRRGKHANRSEARPDSRQCAKMT